MLIGVTGGIGTGKSAVTALLAGMLDAPELSADQLCRELLEPGQPGYRQFVRVFGAEFLEEPAGAIDRGRLRRELFTDDTLRRQLEAILHPLVRTALQEARVSSGSGRFVVAEVPLLFECGWQSDFDWVVCVDAPRSLAAERVAARDKVPPDEVYRVMAVQLPSEVKKKQADYCIDNTGDDAATEKQVTELASFLRSRFGIVAKS